MGSAVKGMALKNAVKKHLENQGHEIIDVGCYSGEKFIKYTSVSERVAKALQDGLADLAINFCGSGTGAAISANKFKGVLACACESIKTAALIRVVNGANCLCMGEEIVSEFLAFRMVDAFICAKFKDNPNIKPEIRQFWQEAHDEMSENGSIAKNRELETL